jgi:hypothetical protein
VEPATATAAEIGKIQKFGRYAQAFCLVAFAMLAIMGPATLAYVLLTPGWEGFTVHLGPYDMRSDIAPPLALQIWAVMCAVVLFGIGIMALCFLYALFGALGRGEIYTMPNVRRIRRVGERVLALGVLQIVLPMTSLLLLNTGVIPATAVSFVQFGIRPDSFTLMIAAGLILLVSWIMEIGRRTSEDAEHLRREAELVV